VGLSLCAITLNRGSPSRRLISACMATWSVARTFSETGLRSVVVARHWFSPRRSRCCSAATPS
jgi:hypothetical protein